MKAVNIPGKDGRLEAWTVRDLKRILAELPDDSLVVVASDAEGNGYHPLMEIWTSGAYREDGSYGSEVVDKQTRKSDRPCITLVPMD